ncbi:MAG: hypothetical protein AAF597_07705 [Bacteroidota bacterium]
MRVWKRIFPQEPFDDARLRQTFHWALKAVEAFLAYTQWSKDPINQRLNLVEALQQRNLAGPAARNLTKSRKLLEAETLKDERRLRQQYQLELQQDEHRTYYQLNEHPRFQEIADTLDLTYLIEKLKASWNMLFHQQVYKTKFQINFLDEVLNYVQQLDLSKHPVLAIHYYGYLGIAEDDESGQTISRLRDAVERHGKLLSEKDLRYVILMAINICITKMNQGKEPYIREAFEWYRLGLEEDSIAENGLLTRATYLNIVVNAIKLQEYDWAEAFISNYTYQLEEDIRENTKYFAQARLSYAQKDYNTTMPLLVQVDFKHPVYNLLAKTLLLKIYYELDEFDLLESQVDAMLTYIRRKTLSDLHRNNFNNIARLTRQLSRLGPDQKKKETLNQKIRETSPLSEKKWLVEQLEKL